MIMDMANSGLVPYGSVPGRESSEWNALVKAWDTLIGGSGAYDQVIDAYAKDRVTYTEAMDALIKACDARIKAKADLAKARLAYVRRWNGETIFPLT